MKTLLFFRGLRHLATARRATRNQVLNRMGPTIRGRIFTACHGVAFSNDPPTDLEFLNLEDVATVEIDSWKTGLELFFQSQMFRCNTTNNVTVAYARGLTRCAVRHVSLALFYLSCFTSLPHTPFTIRFWCSIYSAQSMKRAQNDMLVEYLQLLREDLRWI